MFSGTKYDTKHENEIESEAANDPVLQVANFPVQMWDSLKVSTINEYITGN